MDKNKERSPLDRAAPLRVPGQSLNEELDDFVYDQVLAPLFIALFAVLFAGLTAAAQDMMAAISADSTVSGASPYTFVRTARFDDAASMYVGSFERTSASPRAIAGNGGNLFVTTGADLSTQGSYANAIGAPDAPAAPVIPEPETYALMALGLGAIGFSRRHRQSRAD